jgi:hypothetical protein
MSAWRRLRRRLEEELLTLAIHVSTLLELPTVRYLSDSLAMYDAPATRVSVYQNPCVPAATS